MPQKTIDINGVLFVAKNDAHALRFLKGVADSYRKNEYFIRAKKIKSLQYDAKNFRFSRRKRIISKHECDKLEKLQALETAPEKLVITVL